MMGRGMPPKSNLWASLNLWEMLRHAVAPRCPFRFPISLKEWSEHFLPQWLRGLSCFQATVKFTGPFAIDVGGHLDDGHTARVSGREVEASPRAFQVKLDRRSQLAVSFLDQTAQIHVAGLNVGFQV